MKVKESRRRRCWKRSCACVTEMVGMGGVAAMRRGRQANGGGSPSAQQSNSVRGTESKGESDLRNEGPGQRCSRCK